MTSLPVHNTNNEITVDSDFDDKPDCICFKTKNPCSRKTLRWNLFEFFKYMLCVVIFGVIIATIVIEGIVYNNSKYTKLQQILVILGSTMYIQFITLPMIIISCCKKKIIWPIVIVDIVYLVIQIFLFLGTVLDVEE
tara:strand:+ start:6596 stop:7006 length:411 start_codon:yes stop_codon:yes gene_type:complete